MSSRTPDVRRAYGRAMVVWVLLGVSAGFLALCRVAARRHARDPLVMPYQTGHVGGLGEAPPTVHHRLGARRP